ncbi:MAG TPA: ABC transporter permease subunit, partial [Sinorhizobium sp.]|nr:ABC transporter permease subunit [Sinorhizobium sp.]
MDWSAIIAALHEWLIAFQGFVAGIWDWQAIYDGIPTLLDGLVRTFQLVGISLVLGFVLAVPLALLRTSRNPIAWMPVYAYVYVMRGTPLLV